MPEKRRCSRCVMPERALGIELDEDGVCNLCRGFAPFVPKGTEALDARIAECLSDGVKGDCDCVVPVSGGRDSAYVLYYAKDVLGLRPVALHNDNGFEASVADQNLRNAAERLDVPLVRTQSKREIGRSIVACKFRMNAPYGPGLVAKQTCEACEYGYKAAAYNYARGHGIRLVIWGDSNYESTKDYQGLVGAGDAPSTWRRLFSGAAPSLLRYKLLAYLMKTEYGMDSAHGLCEIRLYDYVPWDEGLMLRTIRDRLGWQAPPEAATTWRVDCTLVPLINYLMKKAYGVGKIELGFSTMIRHGKMDRQDAIDKVEKIDCNTDVDELRRIVLGMSVAEPVVDRVIG